MDTQNKNWMIPFVVLYTIGDLMAILLSGWMELHAINVFVVIGANTLLFAVSVLNILFQQKNMQNPNPAAVIRGVMAGTFIKLMGLAAAAIIYLLAAGEARSVNAVFVALVLYIAYTWLEVRISLRMKPKK